MTFDCAIFIRTLDQENVNASALFCDGWELNWITTAPIKENDNFSVFIFAKAFLCTGVNIDHVTYDSNAFLSLILMCCDNIHSYIYE